VMEGGQDIGVLGFGVGYLEEDNSYKRIEQGNRTNIDSTDPSPPTYPNGRGWWTYTDVYNLARTRLTIFECPSAQTATSGLRLGAGNGGPAALMHTYAPQDPAPADPVCVSANPLGPCADGQVISYFAGDLINPPPVFGLTNYIGVSGSIGKDGVNVSRVDGLPPQPGANHAKHEGVFGNRSRTTLTEVTNGDGTSNTMMFGE